MRADVYWIGAVGAGRLAIVPRPRGGDWLADDLEALRDAGIDVLVSLLTVQETIELDLADEPALARDRGLTLLSLPIPDRGVPPDKVAADRLLAALRDHLAAGRAVAVHCRMGIGRSSLIAAALLMLHGIPAAEAWARVEAARGRPVPDTTEQIEWVIRKDEG